MNDTWRTPFLVIAAGCVIAMMSFGARSSFGFFLEVNIVTESLMLINAATNWNISTRKKNVGRHGGGKTLAEKLSAHDLDLFYTMKIQMSI